MFFSDRLILIYKKSSLLLATAFFLGCKYSDDKLNIFSESINYYQYSKDSIYKIQIDNNFFPRYEIKQIYKDTLFFGYNPNSFNNRIDVIHLFEPTKSTSIYLPEGLTGDVSSFYVHNLDSILLMMNGIKQFAFINLEGDRLSSYSIQQNGNPNYDILPFIQNKPIYNAGKIIFNYRHIGLLEDSKFLEEPQMAALNLVNNKLYQFGEADFIKDYLKHKEVNTDFYSPNYLINSSGELIVNYPVFPYLLIYDLNSFELKKKVPLKSGKVQRMSAPTTKAIHDNGFKNATYRAGIATFFDLNYHEKFNLYSILLMHPYESLDEKGKLREWDKRKSSLLILNSEFEILEEILFSNGDLLMNAIVGVSDGVIFAKHMNTEHEEFNLHYRYYIPF